MNEYEKIIKIVVTNVAKEKMKYEDAIAILTNLFIIAENNRSFINKNIRPYIPPVTFTDVSTSAESLLKKAITLSNEENENNA